MRKTLIAAAVIAAALPAHALTTGDFYFTSFNADEDGLSFVSFVDIAANTSIYFTDNEWNGSAIGGGGAFNTGEGTLAWSSGASSVAAGTVVRLSSVQLSGRSASIGTLSTALSGTFDGNASGEVFYAYIGAAGAPTAFLGAVTNGAFGTDGSIVNTGLVAGTTAIDLNGGLSTSPDYAEYTGMRTGAVSFATYQPLLMDTTNWFVDGSNGLYATTVPDTTSFTLAPIPEPGTYALLLAGLATVGFVARRRRG